MLGFGPVSSYPVSGAGQFDPFGPGPGPGSSSLSSGTRDRYVLARLIGFRSSYSSLSARPWYRVEDCGFNSPSSSRVLTQGRMVHPNHRGRPRYKTVGSASSLPSNSVATGQRVLARMLGFKSSWSSLSPRPWYFARPPCQFNVPKPGSSSSRSSDSLQSYGSYSPPCCPTRTVWPFRALLSVEVLSGPCTSFATTFDNQVMQFYPPGNTPYLGWEGGWFYGAASAGNSAAQFVCHHNLVDGSYTWVLTINNPVFMCTNNGGGINSGQTGWAMATPFCGGGTPFVFTADVDYVQTFEFPNPCCPNSTTTRHRLTVTEL